MGYESMNGVAVCLCSPEGLGNWLASECSLADVLWYKAGVHSGTLCSPWPTPAATHAAHPQDLLGAGTLGQGRKCVDMGVGTPVTREALLRSNPSKNLLR